MRRHRRHGLRAGLVLGSAAAAWWYLDGPVLSAAGLEHADWPGLGWAALGAVLGAEAARALLFFTGPAWWVALAGSRARKAWRHAHEARPHIPDRLRRWVYAADRYACVACGAVRGALCEQCDGLVTLQLEHMRAWSWGGLTSLRNLITLCSHCNRVKSNYIEFGGRPYYRGWEDRDDIEAAAAIYHACLAARRRPSRLARLAWAHWLG